MASKKKSPGIPDAPVPPRTTVNGRPYTLVESPAHGMPPVESPNAPFAYSPRQVAPIPPALGTAPDQLQNWKRNTVSQVRIFALPNQQAVSQGAAAASQANDAVQPVAETAAAAATTATTANETANSAGATAATAATGVTTINGKTAVAIVSGQLEQIAVSSLGTSVATPTQDNLADGSTYARVLATALTGNAIDSTKSGFLGSYGSVPATIVGNTASIFSYTSTSTSATISWSSFLLYFSDGTTVTIASGSQTVTGLTAGTYVYYPYVANGATTVSFVAGVSGSSGTPAIFYNPATALAAQAQNAQAATALSVGSVTIVVMTGGSGSGGGSGRCCVSTTKVETREKGIVPISECEVGDHLRARSGWTEIFQFRLAPQKLFTRFTLHDGSTATVTATHCITAIRHGEEQSVPAAQVCLTDFLVTRTGYAAIKKIELVEIEDGQKAVLSCRPDPVFFGGDQTPTTALHNAVPIS